jgi:hypothetical protein
VNVHWFGLFSFALGVRGVCDMLGVWTLRTAVRVGVADGSSSSAVYSVAFRSFIRAVGHHGRCLNRRW